MATCQQISIEFFHQDSRSMVVHFPLARDGSRRAGVKKIPLKRHYAVAKFHTAITVSGAQDDQIALFKSATPRRDHGIQRK